MIYTSFIQELEKQTTTLVQNGYLQMMGYSHQVFLNKIENLKKKLEEIPLKEIDLVYGYLPFVLVVQASPQVSEKMMSSVKLDDKNGIVKLHPHTLSDFSHISTIAMPSSLYLLVDIDRGKGSLNIPPSQALESIVAQNRTPLTIEEGISILTHYPNFLMKNNCFSLLGSRHEGDKRVPAIWINGDKQPNLGWCWNGNPHTWLGSASALRRIEA